MPLVRLPPAFRFLFVSPQAAEFPAPASFTGTSLEDGAQVIAKIATTGSAASIILERETHILGRLSEALDTAGTTMRVVDL